MGSIEVIKISKDLTCKRNSLNVPDDFEGFVSLLQGQLACDLEEVVLKPTLTFFVYQDVMLKSSKKSVLDILQGESQVNRHRFVQGRNRPLSLTLGNDGKFYIPLTNKRSTIYDMNNVKSLHLAFETSHAVGAPLKFEVAEESCPTSFIFVLSPTGKKLTLGCSFSDKIENLMREIEREEGILMDQQSLIYAGKRLEAKQSLSDYNITRECELHLTLRIFGGMFHPTSGRIDYGQADKVEYPFTLAFADGEVVLSLPNLYKSMTGGELYDIIAGAAKSALQRRLEVSKTSLSSTSASGKAKKKQATTFEAKKKVVLGKDEAWWLERVKRERELRLSDEIQEKYEAAERSNATDWLEVTSDLQEQCLLEAGVDDKDLPSFKQALQTVHRFFPRLAKESIQVKFNRARKGDLIAGMPAPDCVVAPLGNPSATHSVLDLEGSDGKSLLLVAGSYS